MVAAYAEWRVASQMVDEAYRSWGSGTGIGADDAFARYGAALDFEELAADMYADLVRLVAELAPWRTTSPRASSSPRRTYGPSAG
jgi:hypothetical protein